MQQVAQITEIINEILLANDLGTIDGNVDTIRDLAEDCAVALVKASLDQLAAVLGTELETDEAGQVTLNLGALY
jgi:hypothetical protein|tara:strand:- start:482 stop:703 length:222 start_codon:yes stop_codon:yes gene_type:complete